MRFVPAILYHLIPVIPLVMGYNYITVGAVLLVILAYVKVQKLRISDVEFEKKTGTHDPGLRKTMRFWERLTFLKPLPDDGR
ncbi:MAG: hypothetical protein H7249_17265 [Chitinophagaceae bacterium]|nr:hypothetical protein [Oligoflexus sp.]